MPRVRKPRSGSMQFWPRVRSKRAVARVRAWANINDTTLLGFAGYKAGMTQVYGVDAYKNSPSKGEDITIPATIIECPPLKIAFLRFYKSGIVSTQILSSSFDKELARKLSLPKKPKKIEEINPSDYDDVTAMCYTSPKLTGIGKKKPELFEIKVGGSYLDKLAYLKERLGKEIVIGDIFKEGDLLDFHVITKGKGTQGPMRRFGISLKHHKSEKGRRNPGAISGGWVAQGHMMFRTAHSGQKGSQMRTEYNKLLLKIGTKPEEVNQSGGIMRYGEVKTQYILIKGSVGGAKSRLVRFNTAIRPNKKISVQMPTVESISVTRK